MLNDDLKLINAVCCLHPSSQDPVMNEERLRPLDDLLQLLLVLDFPLVLRHC